MPYKRESDYYYLTREEKEFLKRHGIEENNISKDMLARLMDKEEIKNSIHDSNLMNAIKHKMNMKSFSSLDHTSHIPLETEAKFYLSEDEYSPIKLYKSLDNFQLWEIKLHKNSARLRKGAKGKIVLDYYNVNHGFESEVLDTFHLDKDYIKIPHSILKQLTQRKNPRIKTDIEATMRVNGHTYDVKIADMSLNGAKVEVKNDGRLNRNTTVELEFRFGNARYNLSGKIVYAGIYSIGLLIEHLPSELRHYIERELKELHLQNEDSHKGGW